MQQTDVHRLERLRWRSRRGLLELELLLNPFVDLRVMELESGLVDQYEALLDHDDVDVHEWLLQRNPPPADVADIVSEIRRFLSLDSFPHLDEGSTP